MIAEGFYFNKFVFGFKLSYNIIEYPINKCATLYCTVFFSYFNVSECHVFGLSVLHRFEVFDFSLRCADVDFLAPLLS